MIHPDYNSFSGDDFDIALIELDEPAPSSFRPVKLNFDDDAPKDWSIVRAAGYGQQSFFQGFPSDDFFRFVDLPVVPSTICERQYRGVTDITNKILCAGYLKSATCSPCFGDSGGPLFAYDDDGFEVQVGVTSAGRGCGLPGSPGLFVKISAFEDWMKNEGALPEEGSINDSFVEGVDEDGVLSPEDSEDSTNSNSDAGSNIQGATGEEDSKVNGSEDSGDNDGSEDSGDDDDGDDEDDDSNRDPSLSRGGNAISTGAIVGIAVGAFVAVVIVVVAVVSIRTRLKRGNTSPDIPPTVQPPPAPLTLSEAAAAASAAAAEESTVDAVPETGRDVFGSDANVAPAVPAPHAQSGMS